MRNFISASNQACPHCGHGVFNKSHRRGFFERLVLGLLRMRPYRCDDACDKRFYGPDAVSPKLPDTESTGGPTN
jgi:hypothetical protein